MMNIADVGSSAKSVRKQVLRNKAMSPVTVRGPEEVSWFRLPVGFCGHLRDQRVRVFAGGSTEIHRRIFAIRYQTTDNTLSGLCSDVLSQRLARRREICKLFSMRSLKISCPRCG